METEIQPILDVTLNSDFTLPSLLKPILYVVAAITLFRFLK